MNGLKDHEIARVVNAVRDELKPLVQHQCLREMVSKAVVSELEVMGRRIDKQSDQNPISSAGGSETKLRKDDHR